MDFSTHKEALPIPIPISSKYVGNHDHGHDHNPPPLPLPTTTTTTNHNHHHKRKEPLVVRYKECLKNHAATIGGNATDGCGEFMPSGEEGTMEALKCSACNCHRNFHRREDDHFYHHLNPRKGVLTSGSKPFEHRSLIPMQLGAMQTSESDMEGGVVVFRKKRYRTRFTQEQKEKMFEFADRVGWRIQRLEESVVQQFCEEIGVKKRVLKVWMHNNKHHLAKNPRRGDHELMKDHHK